MKIKYLGHASFLLTTEGKKKIITDPYTVTRELRYSPIDETADVVTVSHGHGDHNNAAAVKGNPTVLKDAGKYTIQDIEITGVPAYHDDVQGSKRGNNLVFCFKVDKMNVCHLGDLGHSLNENQLSEIGAVDILFIPVGGYFTIDPEEAANVARSTGAKTVIPMHFKTSKADYAIRPVDEFIKGKKNIRKLSSSEVEYSKETLPAETEIIVLQSAL